MHKICLPSGHIENLTDEEAAKLSVTLRACLCRVDGVTIDDIINAVCDVFPVTSEELFSDGRPERLVWPRHVAMYYADKFNVMSTRAIGPYFRRDPAMGYYARISVEYRTTTQVKYLRDIYNVEQRIRTYELKRKERTTGVSDVRSSEDQQRTQCASGADPGAVDADNLTDPISVAAP